MFGIDDAVGLGMDAVGLGLQLWGANKQSSALKQEANIANQEAGVAQQQAGVSINIAQNEQYIEGQKNQQMQLEGRRSQLENFRNTQRLRAQATAAAVNQGAQFGSGLQGGLGQITNKGAENALGINQGLAIGQNIFGFNQNISGDKMQMAELGSQMATLQGKMAIAQGGAQQGAGLQSLGGSVMQSGKIFGSFAKDIFSGTS